MQLKPRSIHLFTLIAIMMALGGLGKSALACDCLRRQEVPEELKRSSAVFVGVVTVANRSDRIVVQFQVERTWKGPRTKKLTLRMSVNSCSFGFKAGEKYLVYADGGKVLSTSICSRTKPFDQAAADLSVLGEGKKV